MKCSGNWMWAAKAPGQGAALAEAVGAAVALLSQLGVAVDGGKDSLSMAARVGSHTVLAPGEKFPFVTPPSLPFWGSIPASHPGTGH